MVNVELEKLLLTPPALTDIPEMVNWTKKIIASMGNPREYHLTYPGNFAKPFSITFKQGSLHVPVAKTPKLKFDKHSIVYLSMCWALGQKGTDLKGIWDFYRDAAGKVGHVAKTAGSEIAALI